MLGCLYSILFHLSDTNKYLINENIPTNIRYSMLNITINA